MYDVCSHGIFEIIAALCHGRNDEEGISRCIYTIALTGKDGTLNPDKTNCG